MNCSEVRQQIVAFVDGELDGSRRDAVETHVAECAGCMRRVAFERNFNRMLRESLQESEVPRRVLSRVRRGISAEARSRPVGPLRWLWHPLTGYALAAALVLALALPGPSGLVRGLTGGATVGDTVQRTLEGRLVCLQCDRAHRSYEDQRRCREHDHQTGVRAEDGSYWALVNRGPGAELTRNPELRGREVRLGGSAYPEIGTFDVRVFELS